MLQPVDPITEADLQAYVENQLPMPRRIEVEAYLAGTPADAMRVMADLRIRDELRLALADMPRMGSIDTTEAARRLQRGLARGQRWSQARRIAAVGLLLCAGWFAHGSFGPLGVSQVVASAIPPTYVAAAVEAHRTALVRAGMRSQPQARDYDPAEIRAATAIVMPELPGDWAVDDVQVFPSSFGPSVEVKIDTRTFGKVSLFAVRPGWFDVVKTTVTHQQGLNAAYWQIGDVAYALVADAEARKLDKAASKLSRSLH